MTLGRRVHPVHARDGGRQGLRVHAADRHARVAVHRGARHAGACSARWRARACCAARFALRRGPARARAHGSTSWATRSGSSRCPARSWWRARSRSPGSGSTSASTSSRAPGSRPRSSSRRRSTRCAASLTPLGYGDAKIQQVNDPELGNERPPDLHAHARADEGQRGRAARSTRSSACTRADFSASSVGPTFGQEIARTAIIAIIASLVLISIYIGLQIRVQVRGAGADRAGARPPHHLGRVRPLPEGGNDVDRRCPAHDPGLLAVRHDHRVRPNTRERAADAARHVLADREPLDVRGDHPIAGHVAVDAAADRRADVLRRRDAARLRLRAADRRRVRHLLVDLHRGAGADALEGARDGVAPARADRAGGPRRRDPRVRRRRPSATRGASAPRREPAQAAPAPRPSNAAAGRGDRGTDVVEVPTPAADSAVTAARPTHAR